MQLLNDQIKRGLIMKESWPFDVDNCDVSINHRNLPTHAQSFDTTQTRACVHIYEFAWMRCPNSCLWQRALIVGRIIIRRWQNSSETTKRQSTVLVFLVQHTLTLSDLGKFPRTKTSVAKLSIIGAKGL